MDREPVDLEDDRVGPCEIDPPDKAGAVVDHELRRSNGKTALAEGDRSSALERALWWGVILRLQVEYRLDPLRAVRPLEAIQILPNSGGVSETRWRVVERDLDLFGREKDTLERS